MSEYAQSKHDRGKDEPIQIRRHNPDAWSEEGDKTILKLDDVVGSRKLLKDIPDYVIGSGSRGDAITFDTKEPEGFLAVPLSEKGAPFESLVRALKRRRS